MFMVLLRFSAAKERAAEFMDAHNQWLKRGFDDQVFILAGGIQPAAGGCVLAHNTTLADLQARVARDPFVAEQVVRSEIVEIKPGKADARLEFLLG